MEINSDIQEMSDTQFKTWNFIQHFFYSDKDENKRLVYCFSYS